MTDLLESLRENNPSEFRDKINELLMSKLADRLELAKADYASSLFEGEEPEDEEEDSDFEDEDDLSEEEEFEDEEDEDFEDEE